MRLTLNNITKALASRGYPDEIVRGEGYFYFWGDDASSWYNSSVYVPRLDCFPSVDKWVELYENLREQYHNK